MDTKTVALLKFVVGPLVAGLISIYVARAQQEPRNNQGAVGYATLADRVNSLELQVEVLSKACAAPAAVPSRTFKFMLQPLPPPGLTPLKRVPSRLEHLPAQ
jgi:hypothetical protein